MGFVPSKKNAVLALLSGIIFKTYDDVVDMKLIEDSFYLELIKVALVCFITLIAIEDIYISLIFVCVSLHCVYIKTTDTPFWRACVIIPIITTIIILCTQSCMISNDTLMNVGIIILIVICNYIENEAYPENKSDFKTLSRLICNGGYIYLLYLVHYQLCVNGIPITEHMTTLIYCGSIFALGYNITNIAIQYLCNIPNDTLPMIKEDSSIFYKWRRWIDNSIIDVL
jgi:hypothetical protein